MISSVLTYVISNPLGDFAVKDLETEQRVKLSALHAVAVVLLIAQHCQILRIKRSVCPYVHLIISYFYFIEKRIYPKHIKSASVVIVDLKTSNTISLFVLLKKKCALVIQELGCFQVQFYFRTNRISYLQANGRSEEDLEEEFIPNILHNESH